MPTRAKYTLLTYRGIPIGVDWTWFLVLFLVIWLLSGYYDTILGSAPGSVEPYLLAVVTAFGFFGSIVLHELGHAIVAMRNKIGISGITLWLFGGVARLDREPQSAGVEFRIAAAGPAVTLVIAALCLLGGWLIDGGAFLDATTLEEGAGISGAVAVLVWLGNINLIILVFNLLPAFPLDGGRITRAIAWRVTGDREKATGFAARLGQGFAMLFIALGVFIAFSGNFVTGIWLALIGWMLGSAARATVVRNELNRRLGDVRVADVMDSEPVAIPADTSVERALDEYFLRYRWPWFPVVDATQRFVGLINRGTADAVPEPVRESRRVSDVIDGDSPHEQRIESDAPIESLLANVELRKLGGLAAVDPDGRLRGVITLEQVTRALRDATSGEPGQPARPPE